MTLYVYVFSYTETMVSPKLVGIVVIRIKRVTGEDLGRFLPFFLSLSSSFFSYLERSRVGASE